MRFGNKRNPDGKTGQKIKYENIKPMIQIIKENGENGENRESNPP